MPPYASCVPYLCCTRRHEGSDTRNEDGPRVMLIDFVHDACVSVDEADKALLWTDGKYIYLSAIDNLGTRLMKRVKLEDMEVGECP